MDKLGKFELNAWTVLGGLVIAYVAIAPFRTWVDGMVGGLGGGAAGGAGGTIPTIECVYDGAVMTVGPLEKRFDPTTAITLEGARLIINDKDRGMFNDGSTVDVTYKDKVQVFYAQNSTSDTNDASVYYGDKQEFTVPCASTLSTGDDTLPGAEASHIVLGAVPTIAFFNDDDGLKNTRTNNESMTGSDSANIEMKITQPSETGYSPFGKQIIALRYNSSLYDTPTVSVIDGVASVASASCPTFIANTGTKFGSKAGFSLACFEIPGVGSQSTVVQRLNVGLKTKSVTVATDAEGAYATLTKNQVNVSIFDQSWYRHTESGLILFGSETDLNGNVGMHSIANQTIYVRG